MPALSKTEKNWRRLLRWLRKEFPADMPVRIITRKLLHDTVAETAKTKKYYYIFIHTGLSEQVLFDATIHEWAHVLSWSSTVNEHHGMEWGKAYARIYKKYTI